MAKILNLVFIKEILKNQLKVRKHTPQNVDIFSKKAFLRFLTLPLYKNHDLPLKPS